MKHIFIFILAFISCAIVKAQNDWENPEIFEVNQTEAHAPLTPFIDLNEALNGNREACEFFLSLNGTWKFKWTETVADAPVDFYKGESFVNDWGDIRVPSDWQMQGYGHPMFRNVAMEFPEKPPTVPEYYNPTGSYFRTFEVPASWAGRQLFLHFEGVKSASFVWVNGEQVGYNQGGFEPAEYDVTKFVRSGKNAIAVKVLRYSDGSFLENQDMWRLSGIYRNVYLFAAPKLHMRDYYIYTDFDEKYENAVLNVEVELINYDSQPKKGKVKINLADHDGKKIFTKEISKNVKLAANGKSTVKFEEKVTKPKQWSAEKPNLYTLSIALYDSNGNVTEAYAPKMGFRETEIKGNAIYVNGMPIKFNGVNSHVHHPETGKTMDAETIKKDFALMKQFNINLVRTSHYPPGIDYIQLANEYGIYIVDEAGVECHRNIYLSGEPAWKNMFIDRGKKMVLRDRNNPSIVFWSGGNEAGVGDNLKAMMEECRKIDPSRPDWMYGGNTFYIPFENIVGPRYWTPFELKKLAEQDTAIDSRPSFMDEYLAATGNSMGGLDDYWELIRKYPRLTGGAIWDWVSPSIKQPLLILKDQSLFGNDGAIMGRAHLTEGKFGKALDLSGHDEWVEFYRDPSLDITGKEITLDLWVKPRKFIHSNYFLSKGNHAYGLIQKDADTIEFFIYGTERHSAVCQIPDDWENQWHHLTGIYDGQIMSLYIDGDLKSQHSYEGSVLDSPFPVTIGRDSENHNSETSIMLSNAVIDNVRIFNKAISIENLADQKPENAVLYMDFDRVYDEGSFYMTGLEGRTYGLIWADRRYQPELWQVKKSAQPVEVEAVNLIEGKVKLTNRFNFTDLNELDIRYNIGDVDGPLDHNLEVDLAPHQSKVIEIPMKEIDLGKDQDLWLNISFRTKEAEEGLEKGHEVAWEQFRIRRQLIDAQPELAIYRRLSVEEKENLLIVKGDEFEYVFDKKTGEFNRMNYRNTELLERGPIFNVWRAPLANDIDRWNNRQHETGDKTDGLGRSIDNHWRTMGIDQLHTQVDDFEFDLQGETGVLIKISETSLTKNEEGGFQNHYTYRINSKGEIQIQLKSTAQGRLPLWLPRLGLQFQLPEEFQYVAWFGRGPQENYPDRKTGYRFGNYQSTVDEMYVPYLIPQDYGNRSDVSMVKMTNDAGMGLIVQGESFNFSAHHFSTEHLERAMYPFQLKKDHKVFLNIDPEVNGLGDTSLSTLREHQLLPGNYEFNFIIKPVIK